MINIVEKRQDGIYILTLVGRLDANIFSGFREQVLQTIKDGTNSIILDCGRPEYISSAGLRVVLEVTKQIKKVEGKLVLCSLKEYIKEVFEVTRIDALLPITPTFEEALKEF